MDENKHLKIRCGGEVYIELNDLHFFQNKLKTIDKTNFDKLKKSIIQDGLPLGFHVWFDEKKQQWEIIDGHHRYLVLKDLESDNWFIPPIPCNKVIARNRKEAAKIVLISNSRYAKINQESLAEFMIDFELQVPDLELLDFADINLDDFKLDLNEDESNLLNNETIDKYSKNIKSPVYSPKQDKPPPISELIILEKYNSLVTEIKNKKLSKEMETFLILSASRHIKFNYENIAEFYCHQNKEVQDLMEQSALIIIDFNKAIDNGFVKLTEELQEIFEQNNEENN